MKRIDWRQRWKAFQESRRDGSLKRGLLLRWRALRDLPFEARIAGKWLRPDEVGRYGEWIAARWLRLHGRRILKTNYSGIHRGEVDIVCRHRKVLTFVEVKTRTSTAFGRPADAVDEKKRRLIMRGAIDWMRLLGFPGIRFRFDIVEVVLVRGERPFVNIIEDAFQLPDSSMVGRGQA